MGWKEWEPTHQYFKIPMKNPRNFAWKLTKVHKIIHKNHKWSRDYYFCPSPFPTKKCLQKWVYDIADQETNKNSLQYVKLKWIDWAKQNPHMIVDLKNVSMYSFHLCLMRTVRISNIHNATRKKNDRLSYES